LGYLLLAGVDNAEESLGEVTAFQAPKLASLQILVIAASKSLSKGKCIPILFSDVEDCQYLPSIEDWLGT
jgi:hypothetical protein